MSNGSLCAPCFNMNDERTGINVSERMSEPLSAKMIVNATGPKSLPSSPCKRQQREEIQGR